LAIPFQSSAPVYCTSRNIAQSSPKSPMRLAMNAFLPAAALGIFSYQNPMSR
jgi:hypothetical protein